MSRIICSCGNMLSNTNLNSPKIFDIYSWANVDKETTDYEAWYCPECGRYHIFDNDFNKVCVLKVEDEEEENAKRDREFEEWLKKP